MQAMLFDLDEILHDRAGSVQNYIKNHYRRHKVNAAYEVYRDRFIELDDRGYADKQRAFEALVQEFDLSISSEELLHDFRQHVWKNCTTFAGAAEVLRELRRRGYRLGIVTNGSVASQGVKLAELGLHALVDVALISEQEQVKKPDPVIFTRAAERLKVPVAECAFVGDNPQADIAGAFHAGMKTVWLRGNQAWPADMTIEPDYMVGSLPELLTIEF